MQFCSYKFLNLFQCLWSLFSMCSNVYTKLKTENINAKEKEHPFIKSTTLQHCFFLMGNPNTQHFHRSLIIHHYIIVSKYIITSYFPIAKSEKKKKQLIINIFISHITFLLSSPNLVFNFVIFCEPNFEICSEQLQIIGAWATTAACFSHTFSISIS